MKILILEDNSFRNTKFHQSLTGHIVDIAETVDEGRKLLNNKYDLLFLDHDLGGEIYVPSGKNTGYEFAQLISKSINKNVPTIIHSCNPAGSRAIKSILPHAQMIPFVNLDITSLISKIN